MILSRGPVAATLLLAGLWACGSDDATAPSRGAEQNSTTPPGEEGAGDGAQSSLGGATDTKPASTAGDCSEAAKLVYVVSSERDLYSFSPATLTFTKIGALKCSASPLAEPNSMAVDRNAIAWVNYNDGTLFKVDTKDASCKPTTFELDQDTPRMGMAFATDQKDGKTESLYVSPIFGKTGFRGDGLYKLSTGELALARLGDFEGKLDGRAAEFTGTGDARLFGFFATNPASLAEVNRETGEATNVKALNGVQVGTGFAFSFWGGDFWFYTAQGNKPSAVTRYRAATDNSLEIVVEDVGDFKIVGAGVSTCAPTTPPK